MFKVVTTYRDGFIEDAAYASAMKSFTTLNAAIRFADDEAGWESCATVNVYDGDRCVYSLNGTFAWLDKSD